MWRKVSRLTTNAGNKPLLSNGGDRKGSPVSCHENGKNRSLMAYAQRSLTSHKRRTKGKILHLPAIAYTTQVKYSRTGG